MHIVYKECPEFEEESILLEGIFYEAQQAKGMERIKPFSFFVKDDEDRIIGGVSGSSYYGYLYVELLWLAREHRKYGWGKKLMLEVERLGKERNCRYISLTTMDWEGLPFYQKLGYTIDYVHEGFDHNSKMYGLRKEILTRDFF